MVSQGKIERRRDDHVGWIVWSFISHVDTRGMDERQECKSLVYPTTGPWPTRSASRACTYSLARGRLPVVGLRHANLSMAGGLTTVVAAEQLEPASESDIAQYLALIDSAL